MRRLTAVLKPCISSPGRRFFTCLLLGLALFLAGTLFCVPTFYDNDDTNILFALAGYLSGEPYPAHPFLNPLLSIPVSFLYRILPGLPWWYLLQAAAVLASLAAVGCCLLELTEQKGLHPLVGPALFFGLALGLFFYPLFLATFTLTSACLGTAAVCLLLSPGPDERAFGCRNLLSLLFLALTFLFRNSSGCSILCFYLGALVYRLAAAAGKGASPRPLRPLLALGGAAVLLSLCLILINSWGRTHFHQPEFPRFDAARSGFLDYPVDSFGENPELYRAAGWDGDLYNLVKQWFYMDERVSAEALSAICAGSAATGPRSLSALWAELSAFLSIRPIGQYLAALSPLFLISALLACGRGRAARVPLFFALCMLLGGCALTGYLVVSGRIVLRAFQLIAIPTAASVLLLCLSALPEAGTAPAGRGVLRLAALLPLSLALLLCLRIGQLTLRYDSTQMLSESRALMDYVMDHPDTVFIRDTHVANNVDALSVYPDRKPVNLLDWGGTGAYTGARQLQLERFDLLPYTAEVFFREDVRLVTAPGSRDLKDFATYLDARYPGAVLRLETMITEQTAVYQVIPAAKEAFDGENRS